jgi:threonine dehydrogenase-like Zn-dependent dehydrogenase
MERLRKWHPGGVRLLVDATGAPNPIESLMPMLLPESVLCLLGQWRSRPLSEGTMEHMKSLSGKILGPAEAFGDATEHRAMLTRWMTLIREGAIPTERLLTHDIPPTEGPIAMKRFAAGIRSWQGAVIRWDPAFAAAESSHN